MQARITYPLLAWVLLSPVLGDCSINPSGPSTSILPDPFTNGDGRAVTTLADWECRQQEISTIFQQAELGQMPPAPESISATYSAGRLSITVGDAGKEITFEVSISGQGNGPTPAIIAYDGGSIPVPDGVATITFSISEIAAQQDSSSRGQGLFYDLYGTDASAGAMMAWSWGVSRIIDALEATPSANIDPTRIGVTGCSRSGKGAFVAGALEPRVKLTILQESGSGGAACWRLSDYQQSQGQEVQTASEIVTENVWFSTAFEDYAHSVNSLPVDHHLLAGLVAPRPLFIIENLDYEWLGTLSCYGCMTAARKIYTALNATDSMGFSQSGGHAHCQFPSSKQSEIFAFMQRFLLDQKADTGIFYSDGDFDLDEHAWMPWTLPTIPGAEPLRTLGIRVW
ncbi:hypothetical protein BDV25DRAFT_168252 [Aspergillus avenaceus]|uniref:(4-O-methyl)-D-glucuronate--lignin esterase n=1 Tax=Aspergillus avenaceus TaxID=36643 RepID=A0A5N6TQV7_ASPAV|nr:hypothetical protein BDV25DRAFT_168252 [Aspergillus avenaceus]